jgi:hypothetical protein
MVHPKVAFQLLDQVVLNTPPPPKDSEVITLNVKSVHPLNNTGIFQLNSSSLHVITAVYFGDENTKVKQFRVLLGTQEIVNHDKPFAFFKNIPLCALYGQQLTVFITPEEFEKNEEGHPLEKPLTLKIEGVRYNEGATVNVASCARYLLPLTLEIESWVNAKNADNIFLYDALQRAFGDSSTNSLLEIKDGVGQLVFHSPNRSQGAK